MPRMTQDHFNALANDYPLLAGSYLKHLFDVAGAYDADVLPLTDRLTLLGSKAGPVVAVVWALVAGLILDLAVTANQMLVIGWPVAILCLSLGMYSDITASIASARRFTPVSSIQTASLLELSAEEPLVAEIVSRFLDGSGGRGLSADQALQVLALRPLLGVAKKSMAHAAG